MSVAEQILRAKADYDEVYQSGYEKGKAEGGDTETAYNEGLEAGKQAEYDRFWDNSQEYGKRTNYSFAFYYYNDEMFKPKYDIIAKGTASNMFGYSRITNLVALIENAGIVFDISQTTNTGYLFNEAANLTEAPIINAPNSTTVDRIFNGCSSLIKAGIIFPENKITAYTNAFARCYELQDFTAGGVIDIPLSFAQSSKLTKASLDSIITALKDFSGTTTTKTLTLHADSKAKLTDAEKAIATEKGWTIA